MILDDNGNMIDNFSTASIGENSADTEAPPSSTEESDGSTSVGEEGDHVEGEGHDHGDANVVWETRVTWKSK